jgi:hypothetical protein
MAQHFISSARRQTELLEPPLHCWPAPLLTWHPKGLGHGDKVWVDVGLILRVVPLSLTLAQVGVRTVGLQNVGQ